MAPIEILFLFFGFQAFLLMILFFLKEQDGFAYANRIFALFLFLAGWLISYNPLFWSGVLFQGGFIHLNLTYVIPLSLIGPVFFFYVRYVVTRRKLLFSKDFFHFLPFLYMVFSYLPYFILDSKSKLEVYREQQMNSIINVSNLAEAGLIIIMIVYAAVCFSRYLVVFQGQNDFKLWLKAICISYSGIVLSLVVFYVLYFSQVLTTEQDYIITLMISISVFITSYFSFNYATLFNGSPFREIIPFTKYRKTGLTKNYSLELKESLLDLMEKERPYLNGELRLDDIARSLGIGRHHASQIINEHFNTNFFDFINTYRTAEAIKQIEKNKHKMNLAEIGFIAGFNNTVSFNKAFKKNVGVTPSKYRSSYQKGRNFNNFHRQKP